jgi:hypothetical protein
MNPLSPLTYYLRHKRQTLLLVGLVSLMTLGVFAMVRLLDSVPENGFVERIQGIGAKHCLGGVWATHDSCRACRAGSSGSAQHI